MSATTFLTGYLEFLKLQGWEVTLVASEGPGLESLTEREGVSLRLLPMRREPSPIADLVSLARAVRLLRKIRPDVLVYATPKASLIGALAGTFTGVEMRVYELWGLRFETATGIRRTIFRAIEHLTCKLSTRVVANSVSLAEVAKKSFRSVRIDTLGMGSSHGIDGIRFSPDFAGPSVIDDETAKFIRDLSPGTAVIGFIGRVHPDKGIDVLIDSLIRLNEKGVSVAALVVGSVEDEATAHLIKSAQRKVAIHLVGHTDDTRPYIKEMTVLVLPTLREGFPNVVLECAAMEIPAIVSDATGARDSVVNDKTGWIFPVGDSVELTRLITKSLRDRDGTKQLGRFARERALRDFSQAYVWALHSRYFSATD